MERLPLIVATECTQRGDPLSTVNFVLSDQSSRSTWHDRLQQWILRVVANDVVAKDAFFVKSIANELTSTVTRFASSEQVHELVCQLRRNRQAEFFVCVIAYTFDSIS